MRGKIVIAGLILSLSGVATSAQNVPAVPIRNDLYCSGVVSSEAVPRDTFVISGEGSSYKITFQEGDYVFVNKGASQGVKVGDEFSVIRHTEDYTKTEWTKWQFLILRKICLLYTSRCV